MRRVAIALGAVIISLALLALAGSFFGHAPGALLAILLRGSIGSRFALEGTLLKSVPLLLTGLCVVIAFRAGVWNIGAEGQFLAGAIAAYIAAPAGIIVAMLAAIVAGALWASIATLLRIWRNAPEVLTTILLNFIAIHLLGWCVNGPLRESAAQYPQSDVAAAALPLLGATQLHAGTLVAIAACVRSWLLLYRTAEGLRLRATGYNANAARCAWVNVTAQIARAMALSGGVAGLAGGIELLGVTHRLFERFASGYGYSGIAVALLGHLHPLATLPSGLFFGAPTTRAVYRNRDAHKSYTLSPFCQTVQHSA